MENGRNEAAKHFNLNNSMVGRWKNQANNRLKRTKISKELVLGEKNFILLQKKLYNWIIEQRKQGFGVSYAVVRVKMIEILNEPEMKSIYGNSVEGFKTSSRWMFAFMKRYKLSRRRRTKISQKLPEQTNESLTKFQRFTIQLRKKNT